MVLLILIYFVFIGVGLPDSLLGSAWPYMAEDYQVGVDSAGILSMTISIGIIIASLTACHLIRKFGFGKTALTGLCFLLAGLAGYIVSPSFGWTFCCCVPLGFGSGMLQTILNDFVAEHYSARHMNWLHGSWGIGAVAGPLLVSAFGGTAAGWRGGYAAVALVEAVLIAAVLAALPLWKKVSKTARVPVSELVNKPVGKVGGNPVGKMDGKPVQMAGTGNMEAERGKNSAGRSVSIRGKAFVVGQFFMYCSMENAMMLWGASYLIGAKGMEASRAAQGVSVFFLGITAGRFLGGMLAGKIGNVQMIFGSVMAASVLDLILLFSGGTGTAMIVFLLLGLITAPIYPAMLHQTPSFFPQENLHLLMGVQVASAYAGITVMPPLFGKLFTAVSFRLLPVLQICFLCCVLFCVVVLNQRAAKTQRVLV